MRQVDIGDEYRYILDRKYAKKYPGNMLRRPGLVVESGRSFDPNFRRYSAWWPWFGGRGGGGCGWGYGGSSGRYSLSRDFGCFAESGLFEASLSGS